MERPRNSGSSNKHSIPVFFKPSNILRQIPFHSNDHDHEHKHKGDDTQSNSSSETTPANKANMVQYWWANSSGQVSAVCLYLHNKGRCFEDTDVKVLDREDLKVWKRGKKRHLCQIGTTTPEEGKPGCTAAYQQLTKPSRYSFPGRYTRSLLLLMVLAWPSCDLTHSHVTAKCEKLRINRTDEAWVVTLSPRLKQQVWLSLMWCVLISDSPPNFTISAWDMYNACFLTLRVY